MRRTTVRWVCLAAGAAVVVGVAPAGRAGATAFSLTPIGTYETGVLDEGAQEIAAYDPGSHRLFVINADAGTTDVLDLADPTSPVKVLELTTPGANSVAVRDGLVAVAMQADPAQAPGTVGFFSSDGAPLASVVVGALPDMLTFSPNGRFVVVANEGEPSGYCEGDVDPEGSISVIDVAGGGAAVDQGDVRTATFHAFDGREDSLRSHGVRIFGPGASASQDLEPEYIAVGPDGRTAYVTIQEANALAVVDLRTATVLRLVPLGFKDHRRAANAFDASDEDGAIAIDPWPIRGMYQPDAIDSFEIDGRPLLIMANEGDARDYDCFAEEERVGDITLDAASFPDAAALQDAAALGRLNVTLTAPTNAAGEFEQLWAFGGRSLSIRQTNGKLAWDSGDDLEQITALVLPTEFNSDNSENGSFDNRSDNKGPEPEGVEIARIQGRTLAFVGLERMSGIVAYDVSDPQDPDFLTYVNNRDFAGDPEAGTAGDLGPEGLLFIRAQDSPTGAPLLVVANEVSGTTTIYSITLG